MRDCTGPYAKIVELRAQLERVTAELGEAMAALEQASAERNDFAVRADKYARERDQARKEVAAMEKTLEWCLNDAVSRPKNDVDEGFYAAATMGLDALKKARGE